MVLQGLLWQGKDIDIFGLLNTEYKKE